MAKKKPKRSGDKTTSRSRPSTTSAIERARARTAQEAAVAASIQTLVRLADAAENGHRDPELITQALRLEPEEFEVLHGEKRVQALAEPRAMGVYLRAWALNRWVPLALALEEHADTLNLDPRGIAMSVPITCKGELAAVAEDVRQQFVDLLRAPNDQETRERVLRNLEAALAPGAPDWLHQWGWYFGALRAELVRHGRPVTRVRAPSPTRSTRHQYSQLRGRELDAQASALKALHPEWTKRRLAEHLKIPYQRLSDKGATPLLDMAFQLARQEKAERQAKRQAERHGGARGGARGGR